MGLWLDRGRECDNLHQAIEIQIIQYLCGTDSPVSVALNTPLDRPIDRALRGFFIRFCYPSVTRPPKWRLLVTNKPIYHSELQPILERSNRFCIDKFETKYRQLVAEGEGFEEDKDEYTAENIFYVPTEARWERIAAEAHTPEIGQVIDNAMRAIEKENKRLKDILPKNFARPELDKRRLGDVVDLFTNIRMHEHGDSKDILGRAYEYCLSKFAEAEGKLAGEFYTPACIVKTLLMLLP